MKKNRLLFSLALLVTVAPAFAEPVSPPFTASDPGLLSGQTWPAVAHLRDGGWVVTWEGGRDKLDAEVYQQRYTASGVKVGIQTQVNSITTRSQGSSTIAGLADGGWLVAWERSGQYGSNRGIFQQRYAASGAKMGVETQVPTTTKSNQMLPAVTALADGGWLVIWMSDGQGGSGGIYQQRYAASGAKEGVETQVNSYQTSSAVTALADGGWLVTWRKPSLDGPDGSAYQQRYAASGAKVDAEAQVNTTASVYQINPFATGLADGGWLVTWMSDGRNVSRYSAYQQRYAASGAKVGIETEVSTITTSDQIFPVVTALLDGGWVVTWMRMDDHDGSGSGVYQQRYAASGAKSGNETQVNTSSREGIPAVTALVDGGWVVTWNSGSGIYQQRYDAVGNPVGK
jgi:hypothetical protein